MASQIPPPAPRLAGRVALVTGGGRGIGAASARMLAAMGAGVAVVGRGVEAVEAVARGIEAAGGQALAIVADVSTPEAARRMMDAASDRFGRLDYAVNNAGVGSGAPFLDLDFAEYQRIMAVNAGGVFLSMQAELPAILASGGGAIVNVASIGGLIGIPNVAHYVASKHAVIGLTRSVALEYATRGVRINAVAPGVTDTELIAKASEATRTMLKAGSRMGRMGESDEIARAIVYLLVDATFTTGTVLSADGGQSTG